MAHEKTKVYYDGGHYIAIPRTESPTVRDFLSPPYMMAAFRRAKARKLASLTNA